MAFSEFATGAQDRLHAVRFDQCPFAPNTAEREQWRAGWKACDLHIMATLGKSLIARQKLAAQENAYLMLETLLDIERISKEDNVKITARIPLTKIDIETGTGNSR